MTRAIDQRLDQAIKRRDALRAEAQRVQGRQEAAKAALEKIETEIRSKGIEPDKLDAVIAKLETKLEDLVSDLEQQIVASAEALKPFLGDPDSDED